MSDADTGIFEERVRYGQVIRKAASMNEEGRCIHYVCTHEEAERLIRTSSWFSISNCGCRESRGTCGRSGLMAAGSGGRIRPAGICSLTISCAGATMVAGVPVQRRPECRGLPATVFAKHRNREGIMISISACFILLSALLAGGHQGEAGVHASLQSTATPAGVECDLPDGIIRTAPIAPLDPSTLSNPDDPTSGSPLMAPITNILPRDREPGSMFWSLDPGTDWGYDHPIYTNYVGTSVDFDTDPVSNAMFAVVDTWHSSGGDSLIVFRSTNNGENWAPFMLGTNDDGTITNARVCVATSSTGTWIVMMGIWHEPDGTDILWTRRVKTDGTGAVWEQISTSDVIYADMDADIGSTATAYVTFVLQGTDNDIWGARNTLTGDGWVDVQGLFADPETTPSPAITAGYNGTVYLVFIDTRNTTNEELRVKRSTNFGTTWLESDQISNNSGGFDLSDPDIASTHSGSQTLWAICSWATEGGNIGYYYSTNSGVAWTYGGVIGESGSSTEGQSALRCKKTGSQGVTLAFNQDPGDKVMFSYADSSTPTDFAAPVQINDAAATGIIRPAAGWMNNYSAVVYSRLNGLGAYLDSYDNTGFEDGRPMPDVLSVGNSPNPFSAQTIISFTLTGAVPVSVTVFDASGRQVGELLSGQSLPAGTHSVEWNSRGSDGSTLASGVYYCRLNAGGIGAVHRMVLIN